MSEALFNVDQIRAEILVLESRLSMLRDQLGYVESHAQLTVPLNPSQFTHDANQQVLANHKNNRPLEPAEYRRYGRQMILPEIGLPGGFTCGPRLQSSPELYWKLIRFKAN